MSANGNRPTFTAYVITERTGKKNIWTNIGAAWAHADGEGFTIQTHANPLDGKITLRKPRQDVEDQSEHLATSEDIQNALERRIDYSRATPNDDEDIPF